MGANGVHERGYGFDGSPHSLPSRLPRAVGFGIPPTPTLPRARGRELYPRQDEDHGRGYQLAPMIFGSGSMATPKRAWTDAAIFLASASSCAPVAWP